MCQCIGEINLTLLFINTALHSIFYFGKEKQNHETKQHTPAAKTLEQNSRIHVHILKNAQPNHISYSCKVNYMICMCVDSALQSRSTLLGYYGLSGLHIYSSRITIESCEWKPGHGLGRWNQPRVSALLLCVQLERKAPSQHQGSGRETGLLFV